MSEINHSVGVAPLVVIPRDQLDEVVIELDSSLGVEDRASCIMHEIARDNFFVGVSKETLCILNRRILPSLKFQMLP